MLAGAVMAVAGVVLPAGVWAADTTPPAVPQNFQAIVGKGSAEVTLTWTAAVDDGGGIKAYRIERSLDQVAWKTLSDSIAATEYKDTTAGYGLHYFYRLSALDLAGNSSVWAAADVVIDSIGSAKAGSAEATYASSDGRVVVQLPAGLADSEISCSIDSLVSYKKIGSITEPGVVGPYQLNCRTTADSIVTEYKKPIVWTIDLKGKMTNLKDPVAYAYDTDWQKAPLKGAEYDAKAGTLRVSAPADKSIGVLAKRPQSIISLSWVVIFLAVAGVVTGIVIVAMNRKKKLQYEEYIRTKYYDL